MSMQTDKSIRYIIWQIQNGIGTRVVAEELNVSQRHVQRLWAKDVKTGTAHTGGHMGRPKKLKTLDVEVEMASDTHRHWPDGVQMTVRRLERARDVI